MRITAGWKADEILFEETACKRIDPVACINFSKGFQPFQNHKLKIDRRVTRGTNFWDPVPKVENRSHTTTRAKQKQILGSTLASPLKIGSETYPRPTAPLESPAARLGYARAASGGASTGAASSAAITSRAQRWAACTAPSMKPWHLGKKDGRRSAPRGNRDAGEKRRAPPKRKPEGKDGVIHCQNVVWKTREYVQ